MKNKNRLLAIMLTVLLGVLGSTITLRSVAIFKYFDPNTGYYRDNILLTVGNLILIFGIFIFALYVFLGKSTKLKAEFNTREIMITSGVSAIAVIAFAVKMIEYFALEVKNSSTGISFSNNPTAIISLLCGIFAILSCVHFFLNISTTHRVTVLRSYMAMGSVIFLALYAAFLYFNRDFALNSDNKIIDQMAFLLAAVFFLYEARISLGADKWHAYIAFGLIASALIGYSAIPSLIMYFVRGYAISNSIEESVFMLTLFIYITVRLLLCVTLPKDEQSPIIASFSRFAGEQNKKIEENEKFYKEKYAVQLSIDDLLGESLDNVEKVSVDKPLEMLETPSEEFVQDSFFAQSEPSTEANDSVNDKDEVNYEENPGN